MKRSFNFWGFYLLLTLSTVAAIFNSYGNPNDSEEQGLLTVDKGVVINGVKWASRNVAASGTFSTEPEDAGMFYQWNRKIAWAVNGEVKGWDSSILPGDYWEKVNDPSPAGWRVPTLDEIKTLLDTDKVNNEWVSINGIKGRKFTDKATNRSIFLPAAGCRDNVDSTLGFTGSNGFYWSQTAYGKNHAYYTGFGSSSAYWLGSSRGCGLSIRSVAE